MKKFNRGFEFEKSRTRSQAIALPRTNRRFDSRTRFAFICRERVFKFIACSIFGQLFTFQFTWLAYYTVNEQLP